MGETYLNAVLHWFLGESTQWLSTGSAGEPLNRVLDKGTTAAITTTTSLRGAGGFGKTTLALALCQSDKFNALELLFNSI